MKKTEIKNVKPLLQQHIVSSSAEFEKAFNDFQMYKPIKVARELKDLFVYIKYIVYIYTIETN